MEEVIQNSFMRLLGKQSHSQISGPYVCEAWCWITNAFLLWDSLKGYWPVVETSRLANIHIHSSLCWHPNKCLEFFSPPEAIHLIHTLLRRVFRFMGVEMPSLVCVCVCVCLIKYTVIDNEILKIMWNSFVEQSYTIWELKKNLIEYVLQVRFCRVKSRLSK